MSDYRIFETNTYQKDLSRLAKAGLKRIQDKLVEQVYPQLKNEPHYGPNIKRLKNFSPPTWRYRIGAWRFFYEIDDNKKIIFMIAAETRQAAYRE